jgi:hypothetical protein
MNKTTSLTAGALALLLSACATDGFDDAPTDQRRAALGGSEVCGAESMRTDDATSVWPGTIVWPPHSTPTQYFRVPEWAVLVAGDELPGTTAVLTLNESGETVHCTYTEDGEGLYRLTRCARDTWSIPRGGETVDDRIFNVDHAEFALELWGEVFLHRPVAEIALAYTNAAGERCEP